MFIKIVIIERKWCSHVKWLILRWQKALIRWWFNNFIIFDRRRDNKKQRNKPDKIIFSVVYSVERFFLDRKFGAKLLPVKNENKSKREAVCWVWGNKLQVVIWKIKLHFYINYFCWTLDKFMGNSLRKLCNLWSLWSFIVQAIWFLIEEVFLEHIFLGNKF